MVTEVLTEPDFLTFERQSDTKHELIFNEIIEMSGASFKHNKIAGNLYLLLCSLLNEQKFDVLMNDMRVTNPLNDSYCYPDIVVIEGEPRFIDDEFDTLLNPVFIAEILSPSTELRDLTDKFEIYKSIASIKEYMIVAQNRPFVRLYKKISQNHWELFEHENLADSVAILDSKYNCSLQEIYKKVF